MSKIDGNDDVLSETNPRPGNYPLGSIESRAAARAAARAMASRFPQSPDIVTISVQPIRDDHDELVAVRINDDQVIERGADEMLAAFQARFSERAGQV